MMRLAVLCSLASASAFVMGPPIHRTDLLRGAVTSSALLCGAPIGAEIYSDLSPVERTGTKISFSGAVNQESCALLLRALADAATESIAVQNAYSLERPPPIELHVQSGGGELLPAFGVVDALNASPVRVYSHINGFAASAASLICVSCDKRFAYPHSLVLIHQLSGAAEGKIDDVKRQVGNMDVFMKLVKHIYLEHTAIPEKELDALLTSDQWLDAKRCLEMGVVDNIL